MLQLHLRFATISAPVVNLTKHFPKNYSKSFFGKCSVLTKEDLLKLFRERIVISAPKRKKLSIRISGLQPTTLPSENCEKDIDEYMEKVSFWKYGSNSAKCGCDSLKKFRP